ncbi:LamG-like jellyroll fold domain-containing protein [Psychroserpens sp. SPM9]|uniref:LamG-like jellyroll fold domain-containing protein n=1 Tax=Psychroserpens sp. SPM9 TaxID=2975598 RepID=UPI0021A5937A|nr:LamG-like jellyroll fold domain-containing protein [Psychroserpens sp. SPM9]MDG5490469.1 T9SS type A sorting domain-containing protein [Psychroserpens sp. SPM9]
MKIKLLFLCLIFLSLGYSGRSQTNSPSIQSGVTFQWSDNQTHKNHSATIESITVNGTLYYNFGVPSAYELTQLGPGGHNKNKIRLNGTVVESTSSSATWGVSALTAYQSLNLNNYFETNGNGDNICDDYDAENSTDAQRQTLFYGAGIKSNSSGLIAITERNSNNCYHLEFFGIPFGGTTEQSLGETFVNQGNTEYGFGGTGSSNNLGTPGAVNPPIAGSDYWLSDRVVDTGGTIGIALFYLDDIAPFGSTITKVQLTSSTVDDGDGKLFIMTFPDVDQDSLSDIDDLDDDNDGILDVVESGGIDPSADHDIDGIPNYKDADFCTLNSSGVCAHLDFDSDGIPNHLDLDSDNDGITDVLESGGTDKDNDGHADGVIGKSAITFGVPATAGTGTIPTNTDGTGNDDYLDIDADDDGIPDNIEAQPTLTYISPSGIGTSMTDSNGDGVDDNYGTTLKPEDTDFDAVFDYLDLDSDNDTIPDIQENGMANTLSGNDTDADGLDNNFETNDVNDSFLDVNEAIENPSDLSTLPDTDGDLYSGGDLDYRDLFNINPPASATLDFDGINDHVVGTSIFSSVSQSNTNGVTLMAWVKSDSDTSDLNKKFVLGEDNAIEVFITDEAIRAKISYVSSNNTTSSKNVYRSTTGIARHIWRHITVSVSFSENRAYLLLDGEEVFSVSLIDAVAFESSITPEEELFRMGNSKSLLATEFFKGAIDEVRVFNLHLSEDEIKTIVYQEIENNASQVRGSVIKNNMDAVNWSDLELYYPLTDVKTNIILDQSSKANDAKMFNITTIEEQTAPMPFQTKQNGNWKDKSTWLHGSVWYVPADEVTQAATFGNDEVVTWGIYHIKHDVEFTTSLSKPNSPGFYEGLLALGVIVDSNAVLSVGTSTIDLQLNISKYLQLDGTIDLLNDSQLIQGSKSDLVTSATGKILRRQEGNSSVYWYNYWGSPVGALQATSLTDNNLNTTNTNNSIYKLNMLKKGDGSQVQFTNAYNETGKVSTRWLYTYKNGVTYYDYEALNQNSAIEPGIGYTQKGTGTSASSQQFIFEGKPNNGTIAINVTDTGGNGSVPAQSKTDYLLGNPYASALDVHAFIDANEGVIDGTLQLWQQWSGTSHNLNEYDGGYAQVNKLGSVRAYQFVGIEGATNGNQDGTKSPTKYLPVGQGFMVEIVADGTIVFENDQRIFIKESDANGSYKDGSTFFRTAATTSEAETTSEDPIDEQLMQKVRLEFSSVDGPSTRRELLLGFSEFTSDAYDYGYDALNVEAYADDLNLNFEDKLMTMQAYAAITPEKIVPLTLQTSGNFNYKIRATQFEDFDENQAIYLKDNLTGAYFDLKNEQAYEFSSEAGSFSNRFEIVFQEEASLSTEDDTYQFNLIYFNNDTDKLFVKGLQTNAEQLMVINILGQTVREFADVSAQRLDNGLEVSNLSTGTYVIYIKTATTIKTKKVIIN